MRGLHGALGLQVLAFLGTDSFIGSTAKAFNLHLNWALKIVAAFL